MNTEIPAEDWEAINIKLEEVTLTIIPGRVPWKGRDKPFWQRLNETPRRCVRT